MSRECGYAEFDPCMVFICTSWKAWVLFLSSGLGLSGIAREFD
jgi:hypothetical protein